jgi:hypothetical protein
LGPIFPTFSSILEEDSVFRSVRVSLIACLTATLITIPWSGASAAEHENLPAPQPSQSLDDPSQSLDDGQVWRSALALVPGEARLMRQSVATTNESKLLLGLVAGSAVVAGLAMVAYGATSSCKGSFGNSTAGCDRLATAGAIAVAGGSITLVMWALSR